ncbi:MAG TPA: acetyltransferase [Bryobacteraceae bacterium]|nr:acetyltransferase [Bryobacteraceae bacterium]
MSELIIYGAGPFAKLMHFYFTNDSPNRVSAFTVDAPYFNEPVLCGLPVVPFEEILHRYPPSHFEMFVAVGYRRMRQRMALYGKAKASGYRLTNYVSSQAFHFRDLQMGENNIMLANVHVEPFTQIGDNNAFMADTLVSHDVRIGNGNFFSAKCLIASGCAIDDNCFFGNGTVLIDRLSIGSETQIVAGSVLLQNTKKCRKYMGFPAREIASHEEHGIVIERG